MYIENNGQSYKFNKSDLGLLKGVGLVVEGCFSDVNQVVIKGSDGSRIETSIVPIQIYSTESRVHTAFVPPSEVLRNLTGR